MERKNHESRSRFAFSRGSQKVEGEGRKRSHPTFIHFQGKSIIKITEKNRNYELGICETMWWADNKRLKFEKINKNERNLKKLKEREGKDHILLLP